MRLLFTLLTIYSVLLINNIENAIALTGQEVFQANCAACHNGGGNAIMPERNLQKETLEKYNMKDATAITNQVKNGKNAMPSFGGRLDDDDINNVADYVLKQAEQGWEVGF